MRRHDKEITERSEIDSVIERADVCRLAFAKNDEPYLVPVSFGYDGRSLFFHTAPTGRKIDFIAANPRVCFEFEADVELVRDERSACEWTFSFESVVGYGTIAELTSPADKNHALNEIMRHYSGREWGIPENRTAATRAWRIDIDEIAGKRSQEKEKG